MSYRKVISSLFYVHLKWPCWLAGTQVNKLNNLNVKFPKSIAGRTKCSRGPHATCRPRVWDPCHRHCLATVTFFLDICLLPSNLPCDGLITVIMWNVNAFINDFTLTCRREKSSLGYAITDRPAHSLQILQLSSELIATLSYSNLKSFPCNGKIQQQNLTKVGRLFLYWKCWGHWHCHYSQIACNLFYR